MERDGTTRSAAGGRKRLRTWLLAGASVGVLLAAGSLAVGPALAQVSADERVYRREALAHAQAVEAAWRRIETFILEESAGATAWTGAVPPASTGWQASWTLRGLEARYCDDVLLVYLAPDELKGVGNDHRAVHAAPHAYGGGDRPVLHWLENGRAEGGAGRAGVTLPACLSEAVHGGPLPSGRAALAGGVPDPFTADLGLRYRERALYRRAQPGRPWLNRMETVLAMAPPGATDPADPARRDVLDAGDVDAEEAEIGTDIAVGGKAGIGGRAEAANAAAATVEAGDIAAPTLAVAAELVVGAALTDRLESDRVKATERLEAGALRTAGVLDAASLSVATSVAVEGAVSGRDVAGEKLRVSGELDAARAAAGGVYGPDAAIAGLLTVGSCAGCEGE